MKNDYNRSYNIIEMVKDSDGIYKAIPREADESTFVTYNSKLKPIIEDVRGRLINCFV